MFGLENPTIGRTTGSMTNRARHFIYYKENKNWEIELY
jgi:hypothetical protein